MYENGGLSATDAMLLTNGNRGGFGGYGDGGGGYSQHSIDDRVLAVLEDMAGRAGSDYERSRIKEKIDTLRRM